MQAHGAEMSLTNRARAQLPHGRMTGARTYDRPCASAAPVIGRLEANAVPLRAVCAETRAERSVSLREKLAGGGEDGGWRQRE